jgi:hypothetical protein
LTARSIDHGELVSKGGDLDVHRRAGANENALEWSSETMMDTTDRFARVRTRGSTPDPILV